MTKSISPKLSVVIAVPDSYRSVRKVIQSLRGQTVADSLELVLVTPRTDQLKLPPQESTGFAALQIVETGSEVSAAKATVRGIRRATAPLVATGEDHAFPHPRWAEVLIDTHQGPWAAVGPALRNANPASIIGWAQLLIEYGDWLEPVETGERQVLPGHNSCYKSHVLQDYPGEQLDSMFASQSAMHLDLSMRGHRLYLQPEALVYHCNLWEYGPWLRDELQASRKYAGRLCRQWPWWRRVIYAAGSPLIPWVRLPRILGHIRRSKNRHNLLPRVLLPILVGLYASALGECLGYLAGPRHLDQPEGDYLFGRAERVPAHHWHPDLPWD